MTEEQLEALEEDSDSDWDEDSVVSDFGDLEVETLEVGHLQQDFALETPWSAGCGPAWNWPVAHSAPASAFCATDDDDNHDDYSSGASTACPTPPPVRLLFTAKTRRHANKSATRWADLSDSEDEAAEPYGRSWADLAESEDEARPVEPPQRLRWADLADLEDLEDAF